MNRPVRTLISIAAILCLIPFSRAWPAQKDSDADANTSAASPTTTADPATAVKTYELDVPATTVWLDTKIDLFAGAQIQFTATGTAAYSSTDSNGQPKVQSFGAGGLARGWRDLVHQYPVANSGHGALIGRIGSGDGAQPFAVDQTQKSAPAGFFSASIRACAKPPPQRVRFTSRSLSLDPARAMRTLRFCRTLPSAA
jgi:hypothetical protein